jgi:putative methyltransferase (TIGR04325 family)
VPVRAELRALAERYLPPALSERLRARFGALRFEGDYASWTDALAHCTGYDSPEILARVEHAARAVESGQAAYERDGVTFEHVERRWPVLACLQYVARREPALHVLDFGGSLGGSYREHRDLLGDVRWSVVEQPHFVACGRARFANERLRFFESVQACLAELGQPHVLLLSSVLPYVPDPHRLLASLLAHPFAFVIVDRTPTRDGARDRLTVQRSAARLGGASYPAWFFARAKLLRGFEHTYRLREEFVSLDRANIPSRYEGFLFQRRGDG